MTVITAKIFQQTY